MMEVAIIIAILNMLVMFAFVMLHLRNINDRTVIILNGLSHVWGAVMELRLDMRMLEGEEE